MIGPQFPGLLEFAVVYIDSDDMRPERLRDLNRVYADSAASTDDDDMLSRTDTGAGLDGLERRGHRADGHCSFLVT